MWQPERVKKISDCLNNGRKPGIHWEQGHYSVQVKEIQPEISYLPNIFFKYLL